jgi:putative spermidine/putrescine transport system ATP-binding protein
LATQTLPDAATPPGTSGAAVDVRLLGVRKTYGDVVAVEHVDLEISPGEFFTLLGPSGSGKTTTLRLIAGFERPDSGRIELSGVDVTNRAPYERDVNGPKVLLLDEPLGALDLKLRQEMQIELKRIQRDVSEVGITFVYVTHDQEEALTMSDRLAVFNEGRIEQLGTPEEVYEHPATEFVAGFVGISNVLERGGRRFTVRPEKIQMHFDDAGSGERGVIRDVVYVGMFTRYIVELDSGGELTVVEQNLETSSVDVLESKGKRVRLEWRPEHTYDLHGGHE